MKTILGGLLLAIGLAAGPALAADAGVKIGVLTCKATGIDNNIVFTEQTFNCVFDGEGGKKEEYKGQVQKIGLDLSVKENVTMIWGVLAPGMDAYSPHALAGTYVGASASAALGVGAGANVLVGGGNDSFTLQPVSVEGIEGTGASLGLESFTLE